MYPRSMFLSKNKKKSTFFHLKVFNFTAVKCYCILYGRVILKFISLLVVSCKCSAPTSSRRTDEFLMIFDDNGMRKPTFWFPTRSDTNQPV